MADTNGFGALPSQDIRSMIVSGFIRGGSLDRVQPSSLDLAFDEEAYRVHSVFMPLPGETVRHAMQALHPEAHDLKNPFECGWTYVVKLQEELALQEGVYGYANPKSTTGRADVHVRMLSDGIMRYDSAGKPGYSGSLWALVTPRSFRVKFSHGSSLLQLRLLNHDTRFRTPGELQLAHEEHQLVFLPNGKPVPFEKLMRDRGEVMLTIDLDTDPVGYRCEGSREMLDFSRPNSHDLSEFFQPIYRSKKVKGGITLRRGDFYILATREFLRVPFNLAAEMSPIDIRAGDFRAQYAGFFDPGWGLGPDKSLQGTPAVLEVRSFEDNITIRRGQGICSMVFERMASVPDVVYGQAGNTYMTQRGPRLSKHFKMP